MSAPLLKDRHMPAPRSCIGLALPGWSLLLFICAALTLAARAAAQEPSTAEASLSPKLELPVPLPAELVGRPVTRLEVITAEGRWQTPETLRNTSLGQPLSHAYVRAIMREFLATRRYAEVSASAQALGTGVLLRVTVLPRRIIEEVRVTGGGLDTALTLEAAAVGPNDEITVWSLPAIAARVQQLYRERGFPTATTQVSAIDTDEPLRVVLLVSVNPGDPLDVALRDFEVHPRGSDELSRLLSEYAVEVGDRVDAEAMNAADLELSQALKASGYSEAAVKGRIEWASAGVRLVVAVWPGPKFRLRFEGNRHFDHDELSQELDLEDENESERSPSALARRLQEFYAERGFMDASVEVERREGGGGALVDLVFVIREQRQVQVRRRHFPCLSGERSPGDVATEIDGVLSEALPGSGLFGPVDPAQLDQRVAPGRTGARARALSFEPWSTYDAMTYEKALDHVRALYRSEGYLSAEVGPVQVLRRSCEPKSPAGLCVPAGPIVLPRIDCGDPAISPEPVETPRLACVPGRGVSCEPEIDLAIPIRLGPRAELWDIGFEGNRTLVEAELHDASGLELGTAVSQLALEEARRRIVERYAEEGYAFAGVEVDLELSPDRTRAKAKFVISERQPVIVRDVIVRGAEFTREDLIKSRAALIPGELYRRSLVRATEERLATLGVFTSVTVDLEDPEVPARQKVVIIRVQERLPQYLDVRPGFSTGEGLRIAFEYGHRNLARRAIQLMLRVQLGYLPPPLILESDVRTKFEQVLARESLLFLLERRSSATLELPEVGLGPLFRLSLEGLDVRDISRQFALEKRAVIVTLSYRPDRTFNVSLGATLELNEADVFISGDARNTLEDLFAENPDDRLLRNLLNIPDGLTLAVSQRIGVTWDLRDNAVAATRGTLISVSMEHVNAFPIENARPGATPELISDYEGHFLQHTGRFAGYLRLGERGVTLAASLRWGFNQQLERNSSTYPDRLFFLGGVDSLRGFPLWSLVPEDVDRQRTTEQIETGVIPISGGDLLLNPRAELRIPLVGVWQTAVFLDSGNLWADAGAAWDTFALRYSAGAGLRVNTPVGPLGLDYGVNLDRRSYEDFGAVHFSVGLF